MSRQMEDLVKLIPLIEGQHGCVSRSQALDVLSVHRWNQLAQSGTLERVHPCVYRSRFVEKSWMQQAWAATLSARDAVISHRSAARLWGVELFNDDSLPVEITVPRNVARRRHGIVVHESIQLHNRSHVKRHYSTGLPITTPERTLIDLSYVVSESKLACVFDVMCNLGLVTAMSLDRALNEIQTRGVRRVRMVRRVIASRLGDTAKVESRMERRMLRALEKAGVTGIRTQLPFQTTEGAFRLDIALPEHCVCIETDGPHHLDAAQMVKDRKRDTAITASGWVVMRFGIHDDMTEFIDRLLRLISVRRTG